MNLLLDMNLSPAWVNFLAEANFNAVHWSAVGPGNAPDTDLMRWAIEHDHVLVTADLDFGAILAATRARRPSVLQLRSDILTTGAIGGAVLSALRQAHQDLLDGALVSVDASRARLRILPLRD